MARDVKRLPHVFPQAVHDLSRELTNDIWAVQESICGGLFVPPRQIRDQLETAMQTASRLQEALREACGDALDREELHFDWR